MRVTKNIHQIMHNFSTRYPPDPEKYVKLEVPEKWRKSPQEWKRLHPGWNYRLWNDLDSRQLIKDSYPWFLETYDNYRYPIQRVDAIRYFILYHFGGIYSDLDLYPSEPIDKYFYQSQIEVYLVHGPMCVANSFIASTPRARFWRVVFDELQSVKINSLVKLSKHFTVMLTTGPMLLDRVVRDYESGVIGRLPKGFINHELIESENPVLVSLEGMSWCGWDTYILNSLNRNKYTWITIIIMSIIIIIGILWYFMWNFRGKYHTCRAGR